MRVVASIVLCRAAAGTVDSNGILFLRGTLGGVSVSRPPRQTPGVAASHDSCAASGADGHARHPRAGVVLALVLAFGAGAMVHRTAAAADLDPEADTILRAMSEYVGALAAFTVEIDEDKEILDTQGQKLQFSASLTAAVQRPDKLRVHRQGVITDMDLVASGKTITVHAKKLDAYKSVEGPGDIDGSIGAIRALTGLDAPGADLFYGDSYTGLVDDVTSSAHVGMSYVKGVRCHYLAFRTPQLDWQIWIQAGDEPLPMKYVITSKWITGAPQYSVRFRNWNTKPQLPADHFDFSAPPGARELDQIPLNELGDLIVEELEK